jgi:hypothetical protein
LNGVSDNFPRVVNAMDGKDVRLVPALDPMPQGLEDEEGLGRAWRPADRHDVSGAGISVNSLSWG